MDRDERERVIYEAVARELATVGAQRPGERTIDYLARIYEGGNRILRTPLPPETWRERLARWFR